MNILIGCDVDPILPSPLKEVPAGDIWEPLNLIPELLRAVPNLPPITWLIRSDESIRFCTGDYASGYALNKDLWQQLLHLGHEIGWHMHLLSFSPEANAFDFDPDPLWLANAYAALSHYVPVLATRVGWDYASNKLFQKLDQLGIGIDFSALPGTIAWFSAGRTTLVTDWVRALSEPYRPSLADYQRAGTPSLGMVEVPITQFRTTPLEKIKRIGWRLRHGCLEARGLGRKTRSLAHRWVTLPFPLSDTWAFYFHPEELTPEGIGNLARNLDLLRTLPDVEFVTASKLLRESMRSTEPASELVWTDAGH